MEYNDFSSIFVSFMQSNSMSSSTTNNNTNDSTSSGIIPENWLLDLYGLADNVRQKHGDFESAVDDLKNQLNVPPVLAETVARDVLGEIECVDPKFKKKKIVQCFDDPQN